MSKQIDNVIKQLNHFNGLADQWLKDYKDTTYQLKICIEALEDLLEGVKKLPPLTAIAGVLEKECKKAESALHDISH